MPRSGVELQRTVLHTGVPERLIRPAYPFAHAAHGVILPRDQQHRRLFIHLIKIVTALVKADAAEHLIEKTHRGVMPAHGVGYICIHILRIGRQPVEGGAVGLERLVVRAEGQLCHHIADRRRVSPLQHACQSQTAAQHRAALPAGTHQNGGPHGTRIADQVGAAQKRAHRMSHQ